MDRSDPGYRSWLMGRIRSKDTSPELIVRKLVFGMGFRYRLHYRKLPGKPDLVFPGRKKIIFVNGCFWHFHEYCSIAKMPKTRVEFWRNKLEANRERDATNKALLERSGWQVLTIWECELKNIRLLLDKLYTFINDGRTDDSLMVGNGHMLESKTILGQERGRDERV